MAKVREFTPAEERRRLLDPSKPEQKIYKINTQPVGNSGGWLERLSKAHELHLKKK